MGLRAKSPPPPSSQQSLVETEEPCWRPAHTVQGPHCVLPSLHSCPSPHLWHGPTCSCVTRGSVSAPGLVSCRFTGATSGAGAGASAPVPVPGTRPGGPASSTHRSLCSGGGQSETPQCPRAKPPAVCCVRSSAEHTSEGGVVVVGGCANAARRLSLFHCSLCVFGGGGIGRHAA